MQLKQQKINLHGLMHLNNLNVQLKKYDLTSLQ